ncbi:MAG: hypothetical protein WDM80_13720 [Limisphaerales bacterium]
MRTQYLKLSGDVFWFLLVLALSLCSKAQAGGSVSAWGYYYDLTMPETYRPMYVPAGLTNVIAVSAGYNHALALKADGTVVGWGWSDATNVPAGLSNVVSIATGYQFSLALKSDGTLTSWGQGNVATTMPTTLSNIVSVSCNGLYHGLALRSDGTVVTWGSNINGPATVPNGLDHVVEIASGFGDLASLALKDDGSVVAWGTASSWTNVPLGTTNVIAIASGGSHCLALKADGTIVSWGANSSGQTNVPTGLSNVVSIAAGYAHSLAMKSDGTIVAWGAGTNYAFDYSVNKGQSIVPPGLTNISSLAGGYTFSLAIKNDSGFPITVPLVDPIKGISAFQVSLPTQSGKVYALEYKNSMAETQWSALPLVAGNGAILVLTDSTATNSQRFYRVRRW